MVTIDSKTASLKSAQVKVFKISTVIINDREKPIAAASVGVNTPVYIPPSIKTAKIIVGITFLEVFFLTSQLLGSNFLKPPKNWENTIE